MRALAPYSVTARNLAPDSDNKIHDDDVARQFGFTGALVPGVEVFAYATQPFAAAWGGDFLSRGRIDIRFRRPVYDGERVEVAVGEGGGFELSGAEGEARAVGTAELLTAPPEIRLASPPGTHTPDPPPAADESTLAVGGWLETVREEATPQGHAAYLDGIGEQLPLYRDEGHVHPGALLRMVNAVLFRNVTLGPWIHTSSACHLLAAARVPTTLTAYGRVTDNFERNGNTYVRFDALVLADERPVLLADHVAIYRIAAPATT